MKADAPKRRIFNDAVDLLSTGEQVPCGSGVDMLDIDSIKPFRHHPFHLCTFTIRIMLSLKL